MKRAYLFFGLMFTSISGMAASFTADVYYHGATMQNAFVSVVGMGLAPPPTSYSPSSQPTTPTPGSLTPQTGWQWYCQVGVWPTPAASMTTGATWYLPQIAAYVSDNDQPIQTCLIAAKGLAEFTNVH